MNNFYTSFLFSFFLFCLPFSALAQSFGCGCMDCPLPINDNSVTTSTIEIAGSAVNDLGECPLQQVCFEITHTWIGDLSVSLISPAGENYLIMADLNNSSGGCGNSGDNVDVCITVGTDNPLTGNTEYNCNSSNPCLTGNWTVPCGGVTDPLGTALEAPDCDLADFNVPGQPVNGSWTLVVRDVCAQDVGTLEHWELNFACSVSGCEASCLANGGLLNIDTLIGCAPSLSMDIEPEYAPGEEPGPGYPYLFVYTLNDTILGLVPDQELGTIGVGTFNVCGLSYRPDQNSALQSYIGQPLANLQSDLADTTLNICADLSDDCFVLILHPPMPPTIVDTVLCQGDCILKPDGTVCCEPGACELVYQADNGCDSIVVVVIEEVLEAPFSSDSAVICPGDSVMVGGQIYYEPGLYIDTFPADNGCDSISYVAIAGLPIDLTLSQELDTLTANQPDATYQWVECNTNTPIPGATGQSFVATANGTYGVYITLGDCTLLSDCIELTSVNTLEREAELFHLYPNPNYGAFTLDLPEPATVVIWNVWGVPVFESDMPFGKSLLNLAALPAGSYYVEVRTSKGSRGEVFVKQ